MFLLVKNCLDILVLEPIARVACFQVVTHLHCHQPVKDLVKEEELGLSASMFKRREDPSTDPANPLWLPDLFLGMKHLFQISA